ncbi:MAG: hypothetical protein MJ193_02170 [Clostridia bacterium]|nr:hypothetical protein [Clostridia bacterium]
MKIYCVSCVAVGCGCDETPQTVAAFKTEAEAYDYVDKSVVSLIIVCNEANCIVDDNSNGKVVVNTVDDIAWTFAVDEVEI